MVAALLSEVQPLLLKEDSLEVRPDTEWKCMNDPREKASCFSADSIDGVTDISHHVLMIEPRGDILEQSGRDPDGILIGAVMLAEQRPGDYYFKEQLWCRFSPAKARSIGERLIRLADKRES